MSKSELWVACQTASAPVSLLVPQASLLPPTPASTLLEPYLRSQEEDFAPDNPFILHYAAVHHYRSLGWVIKSGVKFCADYLLYKRGPVFSHAECVYSHSSPFPTQLHVSPSSLVAPLAVFVSLINTTCHDFPVSGTLSNVQRTQIRAHTDPRLRRRERAHSRR